MNLQCCINPHLPSAAACRPQACSRRPAGRPAGTAAPSSPWPCTPQRPPRLHICHRQGNRGQGGLQAAEEQGRGVGHALAHASLPARGSAACSSGLALHPLAHVFWVWQQSMSTAPHMAWVVWSAQHACSHECFQALWAALHAKEPGVSCHCMPGPRRGTQGRTLSAASQAPGRPTAPSGRHPSQPGCKQGSVITLAYFSKSQQRMALLFRPGTQSWYGERAMRQP